MEHLYNPDQMSEQEIKATFVARQALLDRLVALIRRQPDGAGVQHVVLLAPRGMGKTTMLLMLQFAAADPALGLAPTWQAIRFPEELYGVTDLTDFWLETLASLSLAAGDPSLADQAARIKAGYPDGDTLQEAALALLRGWCRRHGRRLLLLVDNFQQVLALLDEQQAAALRHVLMNEGFLMILGAAPSFFREASSYDEPLYNFFRLERLERLDFADMRALLLQRAAADGLADFEKNLDANATRLRVLEYFTGGNVRLVLMLYRVVAQSALLEVREGLDRLLDQVTPFYKAKTEDLPPQQRKILDHIARASGQSREGASPSEIAQDVRLTPPLVSAQLKRLSESGYVQSANLRGRSASYTLSEPLYSLWYQMRFGRDARQRMGWLVDFLKGFYTAEELGEQSRLLGDRFQTLLGAGREHDARNALEHRRWLVEAMPDRPRLAQVEGVIRGYLTLKDIGTLKEFDLTDDQLQSLSRKTLDQLVAAGCLPAERAAQAQAARAGSQEARTAAEVEAALLLGIEAYEQGDFDQALASFDRALTLDENNSSAWGVRGAVLGQMGRHEEALASFDRALALDESNVTAWENRGNALAGLERHEEALASFDRALALDESNMSAWYNRGTTLDDLERHEEAVVSYDHALVLDQNDVSTWENRGATLGRLERYEEALASFDRALELDLQKANTYYNRGVVLDSLGRFEEAVASYNRAVALDGNNVLGWERRAVALYNLDRVEEALDSFDKALTIVAGQDKGAESRLRLSKATVEFALGHTAQATENWYASAQVGAPQNIWVADALPLLWVMTRSGHWTFVRELIAKSQTEDQFFPLARALDYLTTGDPALIEKLTPEMRPIVEQVVASLRPAAEQAGNMPSAAPKRRKRTPAPKRKF